MKSIAYQLQTDNPSSNEDFIAFIISAQRSGLGCLPDNLGLRADQYSQMIAYFKTDLPSHLKSTATPHSEVGALRQQLMELREQEHADVCHLLLQHRNHTSAAEIWMAHIVSAACLGGSHLWRDLGMPNRESLKALLRNNFTSLFEMNDKDMRWKKFFYRQLCEQEGHYVCRSPSCESCSTYDECFGEES